MSFYNSHFRKSSLAFEFLTISLSYDTRKRLTTISSTCHWRLFPLQEIEMPSRAASTPSAILLPETRHVAYRTVTIRVIFATLCPNTVPTRVSSKQPQFAMIKAPAEPARAQPWFSRYGGTMQSLAATAPISSTEIAESTPQITTSVRDVAKGSSGTSVSPWTCASATFLRLSFCQTQEPRRLEPRCHKGQFALLPSKLSTPIRCTLHCIHNSILNTYRCSW